MFLLGVFCLVIGVVFYVLALLGSRYDYKGVGSDVQFALRCGHAFLILASILVVLAVLLWIVDLLADPIEQLTRPFSG
jgi:uncharacterized membrane protein YczE